MSGRVVHNLKTHPTCWDAIYRDEKRFEARRDDRFFQRGDIVRLYRLPEEGHVTIRGEPPGPMLEFTIGWTLRGEEYGIKSGYVVFQLEPVEGAHP